MKNPKLFREMSVPFESAEKANEAIAAFFEEFGALRKKHKMTNVYTVISGSYEGSDGEEDEFITSSMFGDSLRAEQMVAWALGREQSIRQENISRIAKAAIADAKKHSHG